MEFIGRSEEDTLGRRCGEVLGCPNHVATPEGCGFGQSCPMCAMSGVIRDTFADRQSRQNAEFWLLRGESWGAEDAAHARRYLPASGYALVAAIGLLPPGLMSMVRRLYHSHRSRRTAPAGHLL
jgi:hypothetical protein